MQDCKYYWKYSIGEQTLLHNLPTDILPPGHICALINFLLFPSDFQRTSGHILYDSEGLTGYNWVLYIYCFPMNYWLEITYVGTPSTL